MAQNKNETSKRQYNRITDSDLYRFVMDHSHIGIFVIDNEFKIIYANKELSQIVGYRLDEIIGSDFRTYLTTRYKDMVIERYLKRQQGDGSRIPIRYEIDINRKDGKKKTVEISVVVTRTAVDEIYTIVHLFDITYRKQIEAELEKSQKKYQGIFDNVFDLIYIHDLEGNFIETNAHYVIEMGGNQEELIGKNIRNYIPKRYRSKFDKYLKRVLKNGKDEGLMSIKIPDGTERIIEYRNALIPGQEGPVGVLGSARDITERIRTQEKMLKLHIELEEKVKERTQSLEEANIALKVLLKKRDEDRRDLEEQILFNIREFVVPYLEKLKATSLTDAQKVYLEIIERNVQDIASPFIRGLSDIFHKLTPTEIQIINLIKQEMKSKEIAEFLNISLRTVEFHRDNIRKKLGIAHKKINLRSYLLSIR